MTLSVTLPWPSPALRPNASSPGAWRRKSDAARRYKADCAIVCRAAGLSRVDVLTVHLVIRFCPPDRQRRDLDNMLGAIKQGLDAVSAAIGVDDSRFGLTILRGEVVKGGEVRITIAEDVE